MLNHIAQQKVPYPIRYTIAWVLTLVIADLSMFILAAYLAGSIYDRTFSLRAGEARFFGSSVFFVAIWIATFYALGLYRRSLALSFKDEFYFTLIALVLGVMPQLVLFTFVPSFSTSRLVLLLSLVFATILVGTSRSLIHLIRSAYEQQRPSRTLVVRDSASENTMGLASDRPRICGPSSRLVKRIFDLAIAALVLVFCFPLILLVSLFVWLDSGVPIFFRQQRVGVNGRLFDIIKFRTMRVNAGPNWAEPGDSRITRLGAVLRRTSTDELPQLFNVLKGDMSLVGPRPEMREFEERFAQEIPSYSERRLALPGITGWAQVNMKRNLSPSDVDQVLNYDLFYVEHWSVFLDLTVLLKTATEFLFHRAV